MNKKRENLFFFAGITFYQNSFSSWCFRWLFRRSHHVEIEGAVVERGTSRKIDSDNGSQGVENSFSKNDNDEVADGKIGCSLAIDLEAVTVWLISFVLDWWASTPLMILDIDCFCFFDGTLYVFKLSSFLCPLNCCTCNGITLLCSKFVNDVFLAEWLLILPFVLPGVVFFNA